MLVQAALAAFACGAWTSHFLFNGGAVALAMSGVTFLLTVVLTERATDQ